MHQPSWKSPDWHLPLSIPIGNTFIGSQCLDCRRLVTCSLMYQVQMESYPSNADSALALWAEMNV